jgi:hypothetical protein
VRYKDILIEAEEYSTSIKKLGNLKILEKLKDAQEESAKISAAARKLYEEYLKTI